VVRVATLPVAMVVAVLCGTASRAADPWGPLYRPLHVPTLAAGQPCPVSGVASYHFRRWGVGPGIGPGPAYPSGFSQPGSVLRFRYPLPVGSIRGSVWSAAKVLWFVTPAYRGRVLIRGQRLDAPDPLRFSDGEEPPTELRIAARSSQAGVRGIKLVGQRYWPSITRLRASGCYAYQVDGDTFSRVVVFSAVASPTG
jgi:hypothetical protein